MVGYFKRAARCLKTKKQFNFTDNFQIIPNVNDFIVVHLAKRPSVLFQISALLVSLICLRLKVATSLSLKVTIGRQLLRDVRRYAVDLTWWPLHAKPKTTLWRHCLHQSFQVCTTAQYLDIVLVDMYDIVCAWIYIYIKTLNLGSLKYLTKMLYSWLSNSSHYVSFMIAWYGLQNRV